MKKMLNRKPNKTNTARNIILALGIVIVIAIPLVVSASDSLTGAKTADANEVETTNVADSEEGSEKNTESITEETAEQISEKNTDSTTEETAEQVSETSANEDAENTSESEIYTETESTGYSFPTEAMLIIDEEFLKLPVKFLQCMDDMDVWTVQLNYPDGTVQSICGDKDSYGNTVSVTFANALNDSDSSNNDEIVRDYTIQVNGENNDLTLTTAKRVVFNNDDIDGIEHVEAEEEIKTTDTQKWVLVSLHVANDGLFTYQSFEKNVQEIYYSADDESTAQKADDVFYLNADKTYTFLIKYQLD